MSKCIIDYYGDKCWYNDDSVFHRLDGPAIMWDEDDIDWFIKDCLMTDEITQWMEEQNVTWPFDEPTQMMFLMKFC